MPLGFSYSPGSDVPFGQGGQSAGASRLSPQQAVKILSLRVPERGQGNAPINQSLLTAPGGSAAGAGMFQSLIAQLMQAFQGQQIPRPEAGGLPTASPAIPDGMQPQPAQIPSRAVPTPRFTPGGDEQQAKAAIPQPLPVQEEDPLLSLFRSKMPAPTGQFTNTFSY